MIEKIAELFDSSSLRELAKVHPPSYKVIKTMPCSYARVRHNRPTTVDLLIAKRANIEKTLKRLCQTSDAQAMRLLEQPRR